MGGVFYIVYIVLIKTAVCFSTDIVTIPFNKNMTINCNESTVLQIVSVNIEESATKCESVACNDTDNVKLQIQNLCNGHRSCMLSTESAQSTCLTDYGFVNFSYSCKDFPLNCDFEHNFCNWKTGQGYYKWTLKSGPTSTSDTGPSTDHTPGSGRMYVYLEASNIDEGTVACLVSPPLWSGEWCLTFWYHMYGDGMGSLTVYLSDGVFLELYSLSGDQGNKWLQARVDILIADTKSQSIIFEGMRGSNSRSDIAVDDIVVVGGRCSDSKKYRRSCSNVGEPINLYQCSKEDVEINKTSITFGPQFMDCLDVYESLRESIHNLCSDSVGEFCRLDLHNPVYADLDCFLFNRLKVEYTCKDIRVTENLQQQSDSGHLAGTIVGIVVGVGVIAAVIVVVICILRRYRLKSASNGQQGLALHRISLQSTNINVYDGLQSRNLPSNSNHLNTYSIINSINANTAGHNPSLNNTMDHQYDYMDLDSRKTGLNRKAAPNAKIKPDLSPGYKNISKDNQYTVNDPKNKKGTDRHKKLDTTPIDNYAILDPNETGFNRSAGNIETGLNRSTGNIETKTQYELAISINPEMNESDLQDPYVVTENGTYDSSSNIRHKKADTNVYSHTVDSVYDKTSHDANKPKMEDNDNTYNHVFGKKTEDDYDVTFNKERE